MNAKTNATIARAMKPATTKGKPAPTKASAADAARDAAIRDACLTAHNLTDYAAQARDAKATLKSMEERLVKLGVTAEVVGKARALFAPTLLSLLGLPQPERAKDAPSGDAVVRSVVKGMADVCGITADKIGAAQGSEARKKLYRPAAAALRRMTFGAPKASTAAKDAYEAAEKWGARIAKEFESFRPKSVKAPEFQRFAQVLFDSITGVGQS
jgi:hypothetical protein